ncbi:MAG TPA: DUF488 family protein [Tepidisphaeraceae bacterium]
MIKVKHFLDTVEPDDGQRLWVEPIGVTRELREWCQLEVLSHFGPPRQLWEWFEEHPDGYEYFRGKYHEHLGRSPYRAALQELARTANRRNITLLHHSDDPNQNSASALHEFLSELGAYCPPE